MTMLPVDKIHLFVDDETWLIIGIALRPSGLLRYPQQFRWVRDCFRSFTIFSIQNLAGARSDLKIPRKFYAWIMHMAITLCQSFRLDATALPYAV